MSPRQEKPDSGNPRSGDSEIQAPQKSAESQESSSAQEASPFLPGQSGRDKITTQEMARTASLGALFKGDVSFEATGSGMGEYMKNLKEKIWLAWFPPIAFKYPSEFCGADAVIKFTLNRKGEVKILRVVSDGGNAFFSAYCMEAIQRVPSFGPLPEEILALLGKDELEIDFAFHYR